MPSAFEQQVQKLGLNKRTWAASKELRECCDASDAVVGQALRYMSYVDEVLAEENQQVEVLIIALEDDQRIPLKT